MGNPVTGCTPVGAGCDHCHTMARLRRRLPGLRGPGSQDVLATTVICHPERLAIPERVRAPSVWLVSMMGDVFHNDVPSDFIEAIHGVAEDCPQHTFCWLTKRWDRAGDFLREWPQPRNVIVMGSVWDQSSCDEACDALKECERWGLHYEPMLGPIYRLTVRPHWIVAGGEMREWSER